MKIDAITQYLDELFKEPKSELNFKNNYELLVAVILSAQCMDQRVNLITPKLFAIYPSVYDLAKANQIEVENIIKPCGFYHNKAKSIISASNVIVKDFNGQVPDKFDDLITLKGVGRKTANVVLAVAFKQNRIGVDTHIFRVSHRLKLSNGTTADSVETDLIKLLNNSNLAKMHYQLLLFGRYVCKARNPLCKDCKIKSYCEYYKSKNKF